MERKGIEIEIDGAIYPCRMTMGAMVLFKEQTGREVTDIDAGSLSDMCRFLWCCVKSASRRDKVEFPLTFEDFADGVTPDIILSWTEAIQQNAGGSASGATDGDGEKKSRGA